MSDQETDSQKTTVIGGDRSRQIAVVSVRSYEGGVLKSEKRQEIPAGEMPTEQDRVLVDGLRETEGYTLPSNFPAIKDTGMSDQELIEPARVEGDRTVITTRHYRDGVLVSEGHQELSNRNSFQPDVLPQETLDRLRELADRFKARLSPESERRIAEAVQEDIDRHMSVGYVVPPIMHHPLLDTGRIRRSIVPNGENYYLSENEIGRVERLGYDELQRLLRDRMVQSSGLPAEVLFDDAPGRQRPPEFIESETASRAERLDTSVEDAFRALGDRSRVDQPEPSTPRLIPHNFGPYVSIYAIDRQSKPDRPPACIDCQYYDGSVYGGNQLICGVHPYGPASEQCGDWHG